MIITQRQWFDILFDSSKTVNEVVVEKHCFYENTLHVNGKPFARLTITHEGTTHEKL